MLVDRAVRDLIAAFGSSDPTPGGGSASALASALGASLLQMVASLPKTRGGSEDERSALATTTRSLIDLRRQLTDAIDADAAAYDQVVSAYKRPKTTADEQQARKTAIQRALRAATDVPLGVMRLSARALAQAEIVAEHGHGAAASDVGVAVALLRTGVYGAGLNVDINLGGVADAGYVEEVRAECARLSAEVAVRVERAESLLRRG
ncbi:MAG: cyclodeaminase/cyclohydrolase family protein [Acidobacteria bacterium]|nr:cyclodeaminase/cyclohydrolase family protein [Acidobacteriota bacterium]